MRIKMRVGISNLKIQRFNFSKIILVCFWMVVVGSTAMAETRITPLNGHGLDDCAVADGFESYGWRRLPTDKVKTVRMGVRLFKYYVPDYQILNELKKSKIPLVVELHGYSASTDSTNFKGKDSEGVEDNFIAVSELELTDGGDPFIVAWPASRAILTEDRSDNYGLTLSSWDAGFCCPPGNLTPKNTPNDVAFIRSVVRKIKDLVRSNANYNFRVDEDRVYITGHSNGGAMTHRVAIEASDIFAAAAPVAFPITDTKGLLKKAPGAYQSTVATDNATWMDTRTQQTALAWSIPRLWKWQYNLRPAIPILEIHGYQDDTVYYGHAEALGRTATYSDGFEGTAVIQNYVGGVETGFNRWAELNDCDQGSLIDVVDDNRRYDSRVLQSNDDRGRPECSLNAYHKRFTGCRDGAVVEQMSLNGNHMIYLGYEGSNGQRLNLHRVVWDFLKQHSK